MKKHWAIAYAVAFGIVCGFLGAGILYLVSSPPRGQSVRLAPPPTPLPVVVHVAGSVASPGVYSLPPGCRVEDAIRAAGGLLLTANSNSLNLAAHLSDGDRVYVPALSQPGDRSVSQSPPPSNSLTVNINSAEQAELEKLPGIGPALAARIIEYRQQNGGFQTIEDIQKVSGIGPATFTQLKDKICIEDQP
jgi:competence protein ComEA